MQKTPPAAVQLWLSTVQKLVVARLLLLRFLQGAQLPVVAQQLHECRLVSNLVMARSNLSVRRRVHIFAR